MSGNTYSEYLQGNKGTYIDDLNVGTLSITTGNILSGSYTPVFTNISAGFDGPTLANAYGHYIRIGDYVHCTFSLDINVLTSGGAGLQFEASIPISSTLTDNNVLCTGSGSMVDLIASANSYAALIQGRALDKVIFKVQNGGATVAGTVRCGVSFIYKIV